LRSNCKQEEKPGLIGNVEKEIPNGLKAIEIIGNRIDVASLSFHSESHLQEITSKKIQKNSKLAQVKE
jgi:hypothetical protein